VIGFVILRYKLNYTYLHKIGSKGEGESPTQNHVGQGHDDKTTYITVETREGKLEQLKVNIDDENFSTSTSILEYLVERGEINPKSLAVSQQQGRGKII